VLAVSHPEAPLAVAVDDSPGLMRDTLLLAEYVDLVAFGVTEQFRAAEPERAVGVDKDVVQLRQLRVGGDLLRAEVGRDRPALRAVNGLSEHQGVFVEEKDVLRVDGGEALA
jgi:hypothetical protein